MLSHAVPERIVCIARAEYQIEDADPAAIVRAECVLVPTSLMKISAPMSSECRSIQFGHLHLEHHLLNAGNAHQIDDLRLDKGSPCPRSIFGNVNGGRTGRSWISFGERLVHGRTLRSYFWPAARADRNLIWGLHGKQVGPERPFDLGNLLHSSEPGLAVRRALAVA